MCAMARDSQQNWHTNRNHLNVHLDEFQVSRSLNFIEMIPERIGIWHAAWHSKCLDRMISIANRVKANADAPTHASIHPAHTF